MDTEVVWLSVETETEMEDELLPTAEDDELRLVETDEDDPVLELTDVVVEETTEEDDELEDPAPGMLSEPGTYFVLS